MIYLTAGSFSVSQRILAILCPGEAPEIQFLGLDIRKHPSTGNSLLM